MSSYLKSLFFIILIGLTLSSYSSPQVVYWQRLGTFNYVFDVKTNSSGDIFVCIQSDYGIKRSTDGGITWETLDAVQHYISKIAINSSDEIFIASDWGGGILNLPITVKHG